MEALSLLLVVHVASGYAYQQQPRLPFAEIAQFGQDMTRRSWSERDDRYKAVISQADTQIDDEESREYVHATNFNRSYVLNDMEHGLRLETNSEKTKKPEDGTTGKTLARYTERETINMHDRVERASRSVAGMDVYEENRAGIHAVTRTPFTGDLNMEVSKQNRTLSSHTEKEVAVPITQFITQSRFPPGSPPLIHNDNGFTPPDVTLPPANQDLFFFSSVTPPTHATTNQVVVSLGAEMEDDVVLFGEDLTNMLNATEDQQHLLKGMGSGVKFGSATKASVGSEKLDEVRVKHLEVVTKSAAKEQQIALKIKDRKKDKKSQVSLTDEPKPTLEIKKTNTIIHYEDTKRQGIPSRPKGPFKTPNLSNTHKPIEKSSKSNSTYKQPIFTSRLIPASTFTPVLLSAKPTAITQTRQQNNIKRKNKKSKKKDKSKRNKDKNGITTTMILAKVPTPTYFPYFKDNYCPPECACYGRVVQCSDKGVDKLPYGIPYNARYILLMNNRIDSIQLDLLKEYVSMEFLVLSNNRLTDATIEGGFEGIPALKRLFLDKNFLQSIPIDLPGSLEELRLDNNHLSVMPEAVWSRCPGLLVLSLRNNSLGSESLPDGVLSPLGKLRTLSLDHNQLASVPLGLPLSIKELYLRGNRIQGFRGGVFTGTSQLVILDLSANKLTNKGLLRESLINALHLESLNLEGNYLKQVPRHLPSSLITLNLEGNLISSINKATFLLLPNLEHLGLARNTISKVAPGAFRKLPVLHQLDLCHNALRQVPRHLPQSLYSAALNHNEIQSVPRDAFCWGGPTISKLVRVQLEHNLIELGNIDVEAFRCLRGFQVVHFY